MQFIADDRVNTLRQIYTFPSVAAYQAAKARQNPFSWTTFQQDLGNPAVSYHTGFHSFFIQDDFKISSSVKLLYGLRYDLFVVPDSRPYAPNPYSQSFKVDKNNFGPRVGVSWSVDAQARTVVRASTGVMYEPPLLNLYENAILNNGDPRSFTANLSPTSAGAPAFPNTLANLPSGFALPVQSISAVDPNYSTQYAWMSNFQIEHALSKDFSLSLGYVNSLGRDMAVVVNTNLIPTGRTLGDGRPIYSTAVNAQTRLFPTFNQINMLQSVGEGTYNAFTVMFNKRMSHGVQFQASYTYAKGTDDAPLTSTYIVAGFDDPLSDPSNPKRDNGVAPFNQTHTFVLSSLLAPTVQGSGFWAKLANNNQLGFILYANSGLPFNIRSNQDLNQDGVSNDRPLGIDRNTGRLGHVFDVDARYVRFVPITQRVRGQLFIEAKNIFNTGCSDPSQYATCNINVAGVNRVVTTDAAGNLAAPLPNPFAGTGGYLQRQIQLGVKLSF
jgi:hypothetical protein